LWVVFHFWGWGMRTGFAGAPSSSRSGDFGGYSLHQPHTLDLRHDYIYFREPAS
jgi:hypothetical protein